jgi:alpha-ribazole phosphatase
MRTSIWLVRHGQTEFNKARRYQGGNDSPLTPYGHAQAQALAQRLRRIPFDVAIMSPSGRVHSTAAHILAGRNVPIVEDARWAETRHGRWEGLTYREVSRRYPEEVQERFGNALHGKPEGGESLAEVHTRVTDGWNAILRERVAGRILVVTHATPIQLIMCAATGLLPTLHWRWRIDLASLTVLDVYGAGPIVRVVNEVPKLTG